MYVSDFWHVSSCLSQAAGLATMISTMRPDIDNMDEYVRNTTARAFAVVASALGIPSLLPFLKAVCKSKKSWQARHTGIKIVQQIAILMGCAILPHLRSLVEIIEHGQSSLCGHSYLPADTVITFHQTHHHCVWFNVLTGVNCVSTGLVDEQQKVRTISALAIAALAEAATPYGIESFDSVLKPLWKGIRQHRGKVRSQNTQIYKGVNCFHCKYQTITCTWLQGWAVAVSRNQIKYDWSSAGSNRRTMIIIITIQCRWNTFIFTIVSSTSLGSGCFPQSYWLPDPTDGRWVCKLLHQGGDVDPDQRVPVPWWGDEKDRTQGKDGIKEYIISLRVCVCDAQFG